MTAKPFAIGDRVVTSSRLPAWLAARKGVVIDVHEHCYEVALFGTPEPGGLNARLCFVEGKDIRHDR